MDRFVAGNDVNLRVCRCPFILLANFSYFHGRVVPETFSCKSEYLSHWDVCQQSSPLEMEGKLVANCHPCNANILSLSHKCAVLSFLSSINVIAHVKTSLEKYFIHYITIWVHWPRETIHCLAITRLPFKTVYHFDLMPFNNRINFTMPRTIYE